MFFLDFGRLHVLFGHTEGGARVATLLCHIVVDAMYLCKITRSQCSLCCVRKPSVKIYFWIYHLCSRPGTAQMRIILRNTKNQVYNLTCITRTKCVFGCHIVVDAMYLCKITRSQCSLNSKTREKNSSTAFQQIYSKIY